MLANYATIHGVHSIHFWNCPGCDFDLCLSRLNSEFDGDLQRLTHRQSDCLMEVRKACCTVDRQYVFTGRQVGEGKAAVLIRSEHAPSALSRIRQDDRNRIHREPSGIQHGTTKRSSSQLLRPRLKWR